MLRIDRFGRWGFAAALCAGLALAGAASVFAGPASGVRTGGGHPRSGSTRLPDGASPPASEDRSRLVEAELRAQLLARENRMLQARLVNLQQEAARLPQLEKQAARAVTLESLVLRLQAQPAPTSDQEAQRLALQALLQDFFETGSLVDQVTEANPLPEGGYIQRQLKLMQTVRSYLRNEGSVAGVIIREVDRELFPRELIEAFVPQNAVYLNAYSMQRLRDFSYYPRFPAALRYLLRSTIFIQEFDIQADPTGEIRRAREFQQQLELEESRARGLAEGLGRSVQGTPQRARAQPSGAP